MEKKDIVAGFVGAALQPLAEALQQIGEQCFDAGAASAPAPAPAAGGLSQADVDAAVAAQKSADDQALADAHAQAQAQLDDMKSQMDQLASGKADSDSKLAADEQVVQSMKSGMAQMQSALDAIKALMG